MSETTARDIVWRAVLTSLQDHGHVRRTDLDIPEEHTYTAVNVLRSMEEMGLLERESEKAHTYYPTDRLAGVCDTSEWTMRNQ